MFSKPESLHRELPNDMHTNLKNDDLNDKNIRASVQMSNQRESQPVFKMLHTGQITQAPSDLISPSQPHITGGTNSNIKKNDHIEIKQQ